jgi:copper(I)-binding protein
MTASRISARVLPVLLGAVAVLLLTACGTTTPTVNTTGPTGTAGNANGSVGALEIRDARFAAQRPRAGDEVYAIGTDAPLALSVVNTGDRPDRLVSVSSPVASAQRIAGDPAIPGGFTLVSHYAEVAPARTFPDTLRTDITLIQLREPLRAGLTYPVTFTFAEAGSVRIEVPVADPDVLPPRAGNPPN